MSSEERSRKFEGLSAISSDDYYGRSSSRSHPRGQMEGIKDGVKEGVRSVAGKLSNIASDLASTLQVSDRSFGREIATSHKQRVTLFVLLRVCCRIVTVKCYYSLSNLLVGLCLGFS